MRTGNLKRVFAAMPVPEGFADDIFDSIDSVLASHEELRRTSLENMHITLLFLGEIEKEAQDLLCAAALEAAAKCAPFSVRTGRLVGLPKRQPRVLAVTLEDGGEDCNDGSLRCGGEARNDGGFRRIAQTLRSAFFTASRETGRQAALPSAKDFLPHVSAARVRGNGGFRLTSEEWETPVSAECLLDTLCVYTSDLRPDGPRYTALVEAPLTRS